jgi:class 3 adenylate cyclase
VIRSSNNSFAIAWEHAKRRRSALLVEMPLSAQHDSFHATVAVIDMVEYSSTARLLEENSGAAIVAELNRQIQYLISAGLVVVPDVPPRPVVKTTGDGAITVFDSGQQAHLFAEAVHLGTLQHNQERTEPSAMRWFRIGIATGQLSRYSVADGEYEYAGITISNAVRLEGSAQPGQIVMDLETFSSLPAELQSRYGPEESVSGKRSEKYIVRKYQVISQEPRKANRRRLLMLMAGGCGLTVAGAWFAWPEIEGYVHPLPRKRFVALMAWPRSSQEDEATVGEVLASIGNRLAHAEAYMRDLLIISSSDLAISGPRLDKPAQAAVHLARTSFWLHLYAGETEILG